MSSETCKNKDADQTALISSTDKILHLHQNTAKDKNNILEGTNTRLVPLVCINALKARCVHVILLRQKNITTGYESVAAITAINL